MTQNELNRFQAILTAKVAELDRLTRQRDWIAIERSPDQLEEIQWATERALAICNAAVNSRPPREGRMKAADGTRFPGSNMNNSAHPASRNQALFCVQDRARASESEADPSDSLYEETVNLDEQVPSLPMFEEIVGSSEPLYRVLGQLTKVAPTNATVLITGESGTGKELIARAIHKRSNRSRRAFVRVNCAAIPPSLIASELFGYEKGAFTGATERHLGRFELANGGTIFLDEIGDIPPETQIALLRVLQEREFERVGGTQPIPIDVRIIAATNGDLRAAVNAGTFRLDLFYRLNVFPIRMPSLRERREDIVLLSKYFIDRYAGNAAKQFRNIDRRTLAWLQAYDWPGNIRELQNVVERAVILCDGETFSIDQSWLQPEPPGTCRRLVPLAAALVNHERQMIEAALEESRGRISGPSGAAGKLGMPRTTLESKIKSLRINKHQFACA